MMDDRVREVAVAPSPAHRLGQLLQRGVRIVGGVFERTGGSLRSMFGISFWPSARVTDFAHDGTNATATAAIGWARRALGEAPLQVTVEAKEGREVDEAVVLADLLQNPGYGNTMEMIASAILDDLAWNGETYLLVNAKDTGSTVTLQWRHSSTIEPIRHGLPHWEPFRQYRDRLRSRGFFRIAEERRYEAASGGGLLLMGEIRIVHLRYELDPLDPRCGTSPLKVIARELWTGDELANFTAAMLKNSGRINHVLSPPPSRNNEEPAYIDPADAEKIRKRMDAAYTGQNRGGSMVMTVPINISRLQYSPDEMALPMAREFIETAITGALGIPGILAGTFSALARNTFSNYVTARVSGYEDFLWPVAAKIARQLTVQLVPLFYDDRKAAGDPQVTFDWSSTRVLDSQKAALADIWKGLYAAGLATFEEARENIDMDAEPQDGQHLLVPALGTVTLTPLEADEELPDAPTGDTGESDLDDEDDQEEETDDGDEDAEDGEAEDEDGAS